LKDIKIDFINKKMLNEYVDNKDRAIQQIKLAVQVWKDDWLLNEDFGVDYDTAWGDMLTMGTDIQEQIKQVPGITSIQSFEIRKDTSNEDNIMYRIDVIVKFNNEVIQLSEAI